MKNYILETNAGNTFDGVAKKAKDIAVKKSVVVEFEFNGVQCLVNKDTNLKWLWRDYTNAHLMDWKTVGADCVAEYDWGTQETLRLKLEAQEKESERRRVEYAKKEKSEREAFELSVKGVVMEFTDEAAWKEGRKKNTDPYGKCAYDYAEGWAKLMQIEIAKGKTVAQCADETSHKLGFYGITGFMYGCAVSVLAHCWKHGEALRKWHNKEYGHEGDGVVNPAVLAINV